MTNTNTQNFFSAFGRNTGTLLGVGRYLMYMYERGTLKEVDSCDVVRQFIVDFLRARPYITRGYYIGTTLFKGNIQYARPNFDDRDIFAKVPIEMTGGTQLYSLSGSGRKLCWLELILYYDVGKFFADHFSSV